MIPNFLFEISRYVVHFRNEKHFQNYSQSQNTTLYSGLDIFYVYYSYLQFSPIFEKVQSLHSFTFIFTKDKKLFKTKKNVPK